MPRTKLTELEDRLVATEGGLDVINAISHRLPAGVVLTSHQKGVVLDVLNRWGMEEDGIAKLGGELNQLRNVLHEDLNPA